MLGEPPSASFVTLRNVSISLLYSVHNDDSEVSAPEDRSPIPRRTPPSPVSRIRDAPHSAAPRRVGPSHPDPTPAPRHASKQTTAHRNIRSCCATTIESCVRRFPFRSSTHFRVGGSDVFCTFGGGAGVTVTVLASVPGLVRSDTATSTPRPRMGAGTMTARPDMLSCGFQLEGVLWARLSGLGWLGCGGRVVDEAARGLGGVGARTGARLGGGDSASMCRNGSSGLSAMRTGRRSLFIRRSRTLSHSRSVS